MLRIGLTGGIGSGKSTVASLFANRGVPVIDTDVIAHDLTRQQAEGYRRIVEAFGNKFIGPGGDLDRPALRQLIFSNKTDRERLEAILHPLIREEVRRRLEKSQAPYIVIVVPLLVEAGFSDLVDRILVVDVDEETQIRRAQTRSALPESEVRAIMQAQLDRQSRLSAANDVLKNLDNLEGLDEQITGLHRRYLKIARGAENRRINSDTRR